jgi:hypothetical protein
MQGGLLAWIGFLLSPLSWWNDLFLNIPLAVGFAWLVALFYRPAFTPAVIVGYWLTNVLGLILLHRGAQKMLLKDDQISRAYSRRDLLKDVVVSLLYTSLVLLLVKLKLIQPLTDYSRSR